MQLEVSTVFEKLRKAISNPNIRIVVSRGGTRSTKTYSTLQLLALRLITGKLGDNKVEGVTQIVRRYSATLSKTVQRDFEEVLGAMGIYSMVEINKTEKTYMYGGRIIEFIGADDPQKLRGAKRAILYCNEANELEYQTQFFQLNVRTTHKILLDFNPDDSDIWINTELELKRKVQKKDVEVIVSTYKDNPFLSTVEREEIENIKNIDEGLRQVYGKGEYGKIQGLIFNNWEIIDEIPRQAQLLAYGLDFGFANDPAAMTDIRCIGNSLYLDELIYETGLTNQDIDEKCTQLGLNKQDQIIADSAEPKSIEELYRLGWNIQPTYKGPDSILAGINIMRGKKIYVTARSTNLIKEFRKYKRQVDKEGHTIKKPISGFDHLLDGIRYVCLVKYRAIKQQDPVSARILPTEGSRPIKKNFEFDGNEYKNKLLAKSDDFTTSFDVGYEGPVFG